MEKEYDLTYKQQDHLNKEDFDDWDFIIPYDFEDASKTMFKDVDTMDEAILRVEVLLAMLKHWKANGVQVLVESGWSDDGSPQFSVKGIDKALNLKFTKKLENSRFQALVSENADVVVDKDGNVQYTSEYEI